MISNHQLDEVRLALIDNWNHGAFYIWHRDYKDYDETQCPYKNKKVIVVQFKSKTNMNSTGSKSGFIPFIYQGVPLKLWK